MATSRRRPRTGVRAIQFIAPPRDPRLPAIVRVRYHLADLRSVHDTDWIVPQAEGEPLILSDEEFLAKYLSE